MSRFFNGGNGVDKLVVSAAPITAVPLTISADVRMNTLTVGSSFPVLLIDDNTGNERFGLGVCDGASMNVLAISCHAAVVQEAVAGNFTDTTAFHHCCARFTSATSRIATFDGTSGSVDTNSSTPTGLNTTRIGCKATGVRDFNGWIAHPAVWNVPLTDDEVASLASGVSPLSVRPQSLVFYAPYLGRNSPEIDILGALNLTVTSTTSSPEESRRLRNGTRRVPRVYLPRAGFKSAWARGANQLILTRL